MGMESDERSPSYYTILGVPTHSPDDEIRHAYRKLAMQWHPDKWTRAPSLLGEAKRKFQQIQEAYSVLSDRRKRTIYDAGLYDPHEEEDEDFSDFLKEMVSLMDQVRKENKCYSMEELQSMFMEMSQGFEFPKWSDSQWPTYETTQLFCGPSVGDGYGRTSKRARSEASPVGDRGSHLHHVPGLGMYGNSQMRTVT
ncbi:uncharacterized protein LOC132302528 isoform X2 [Cornus florida]|uniref:uncharacterized protein LOC132302528 isoform X2 n=1 Tax=Cornus florida TaxID=4283 RepID=UPI00289DFF52|nr:uncharacterized protein LOC132302528 isoform X2 [Cornus florida]